MVMRRKKIKLRYKKERTIFSDILPYELPLIFSNRYFYKLLVRNEVSIKFGDEGNNTLSWNATKDKGFLGILAIIFNKAVSELKGKNTLDLSKYDLKKFHLYIAFSTNP